MHSYSQQLVDSLYVTPLRSSLTKSNPYSEAEVTYRKRAHVYMIAPLLDHSCAQGTFGGNHAPALEHGAESPNFHRDGGPVCHAMAAREG